MKKVLATILAMLYLGTSTGASIHLHYCMGKLVELKLWQSDTGKCGGCGMKKASECSKKCCKDEHKIVKLEKDQQKSADHFWKFLQAAAEVPAAPAAQQQQAHIVSATLAQPVSHAPPRSTALHILHCIFRI